MTLNWDEIIGGMEDVSESDLLPAGTYDCRVREATAKKASTGSDMIELVLAVAGGPHDDSWLWTNIVFPNAESKTGHRRFFMRNMKALGFDMSVLSATAATSQQVADQMVGRTVRADVIHKKWEGQMRTEVKTMHSVDAATGVPSVPVPSSDTPPVPDVPQVPEIPAAPQVSTPSPVAEPAAQPVPEPTAPTPVPEVPTTPPDSAPF